MQPKKGGIGAERHEPADKENRMAISRRLGCWIVYQLRLNGHTQLTVAREADRHLNTVSGFLGGFKDSPRIREALCKVLGYRNFAALEADAPEDCRGGAA